MNKSLQNHQGKEKSGFLSLNPASKLESVLLCLFFLLLPTQLGKHFWPDFSFVSGIRIDYLSPILYVTDVILRLLFGAFVFRWLQQKFAVSTKSLEQAKKSLKTPSPKRHEEVTKAKKVSKKYFFLIAFVFVFMIANSAFAIRPLLSLYGWVKFLEILFVSFYLAHTIRYRFQWQWIALLFGVSSFCESLLAIGQYVNQGSLNGIFYFFGERYFTGSTPGIANASIGGALILRPYATFSHPNVLSAYLLIAMVFVWCFLLKNKSRYIQLFAILSLLINSIVLLLSLSRIGIFIWAVLSLCLVGRLLFRQVKSLKMRISVAVAMAIVVVFIAAVPIVHDVVLRFSQTSLVDESVTERTELLRASWEMIQQHPLFGVGLDNFIPALAPLQKPLPLGLYLQPVHNIFILVLAEDGIVGFSLFLGLLIATGLQVKKQESELKGVLSILLLTILLTGLFDHYWLTLQQGQLLIATILGLSWARMGKNHS